ncbi:hypothetical protein QBC34DRAFT_462370 [Podospora aff. communis PSN243]|uniref:NAD(P)-binding protein n=1 Tax=Podospora aff. communis PSN243 TaxID=3040156 RepID=A0AAV9GP57_9PEZI|nr:hypothetical protein QBC34DRAFT_462370 [Podospora aff. communis PSN243]
MAPITYSPSLGQNLKGRVVVITGGAQGIGAATIRQLHSLGAHVVFGDLADAPAADLISSLQGTGTANFVHTDVTSYPDQLALFEDALARHGRVDAAVSCAGVLENPAWFAGLTLEAVRADASGADGGIDRVINTNLIAAIQFARLALAFIAASPPFAGPQPEDKFVPSVTFTSSLAGLTPTPGMTVYSTTKHGLVGLTRSLPHVKGLARFNAVCPSATDTGLLPDFVKGAWKGAGFRLQRAEAVADAVVHLISEASLDRRAVVVAGGKAWESEEELEKLRGAWLGEENGKEVDDSQAFYFAAASAS